MVTPLCNLPLRSRCIFTWCMQKPVRMQAHYCQADYCQPLHSSVLVVIPVCNPHTDVTSFQPPRLFRWYTCTSKPFAGSNFYLKPVLTETCRCESQSTKIQCIHAEECPLASPALSNPAFLTALCPMVTKLALCNLKCPISADHFSSICYLSNLEELSIAGYHRDHRVWSPPSHVVSVFQCSKNIDIGMATSGPGCKCELNAAKTLTLVWPPLVQVVLSFNAAKTLWHWCDHLRPRLYCV
jgi:hypothetical protein